MMANDQKTEQARQTEAVARCVGDLLIRLHQETGIPFDLVMAAAHGQVVTMLATIVGGEIAAERCTNAAKHVRSIPSPSDVALAAAEPQGRA